MGQRYEVRFTLEAADTTIVYAIPGESDLDRCFISFGAFLKAAGYSPHVVDVMIDRAVNNTSEVTR